MFFVTWPLCAMREETSGLFPLVVMFQLALERDLSCEISNFRVFIVLLKKELCARDQYL